MEIAKNLAQWRTLTPEQWLTQANRTLPPIVAILLVILIATRSADLTWTLLASPADQDTVPVAPIISTGGAATGSAPVGLDALADWRPFGEPPAPNPDQPAGIPFPDDAPETSLALTLKGATLVQEEPEPGELFVPKNGIAIIASGRQPEKTYHTGDSIDGASGATLYAVFANYVLLDRGGRYETLRFPPIETNVRAGARLNSQIAAAAPRPAPQSSALDTADMAGSLSSVAATLSEHITIAQQREGGRTVGFRLQPRGDGQVFQQLGLEPGDVLTEVNGISLENSANAVRVLQALTQSPRADVVIRRNGVDQTMSLDIGQLQRLAESLQ
jgi:general secretion pathway protein C